MSFLTHVSPETRLWRCPGTLILESGAGLRNVKVGYRSWGRLDAEGSNAVLVCHALTGSADVDGWWSGVLGPGKALDPEADFVVASNVLGGCYGTTGPGSTRPRGRGSYGPDFPAVTIRDMVQLQAHLLDGLGVRRLRLVVGGSMGGMQAQEWAVMQPLPVASVATLGAPARHSAWAVGLGEAQRSAIRSDRAWMGGRYPPDRPPRDGLALARIIAMCTYRSPGSFDIRFHRERRSDGAFQVESYLRHQGEKLVERFDANSYLTITRAMDSHDLARGRGSLAAVLDGIEVPALILGIRSDVLYPPREMEALAAGLPRGELRWIESPHGHDAFLMEQEQVSEAIRGFRQGLSAEDGRGQRCA